MYSGTTLTKFSGRVIGTHQKIDRIARKKLTKLLGSSSNFPTTKQILHFEGKNGPDAIKRKSPAHDEPWHYFNPFDEDDEQLLDLIKEHYKKLVDELKNGSLERSAFEAAWLAHALVDGMTPAHHFPYEEGLAELSAGTKLEDRTSVKKKLVMPGESKKEQIKNNWKAWGPKGLRTAHGLFEMGIATLIAPLTFSEVLPSAEDLDSLLTSDLADWFRAKAREIAVMDIYHSYIKKGWTPKLAWQVRHKLGPALVDVVLEVWYKAAEEAGIS